MVFQVGLSSVRCCTKLLTASTIILLATSVLLSFANEFPDFFSSRVRAIGRQNQTAIECPLSRCPISTVCNPNTNRCECANEHLVSVSPYMPCLTRKYLGESCIISAQCNHIQQGICVSNSRIRNELQSMPSKDFSKNPRMLKHPEKYLSRNEYGRCECRTGYWPNPNHQCIVKRLDSVDCSDSNQCPDQNSRCDYFRKKCVCDFGHKYDAEQDRCLLNVDGMFGVFCKEDLDCQIRHDQMRCFMGICTCLNNNRFDPFRGCGHVHACKSGHTWNDFSKSCEPTVYNYHRELETDMQQQQYESRTKFSFKRWTKVNAEVCFKLLVFVLFIIGMTYILKNRKACFPTSQLSNLAPYETNRTPRGTRSNRFSNGMEPPSRVHVRVNLTEFDDMESGALMVNLPNLSNRRLSLCSNSSLPPYEATNNQQTHDLAETVPLATPPPSYQFDQLPTYDEAISGLAKDDDFCAKDEHGQLSKSTPTLAVTHEFSLNSIPTSASSSPSTHSESTSSDERVKSPDGSAS